MIRRIINQRNSTWRWQDVMSGRADAVPRDVAETVESRPYRRWVLSVWERRAKAAWRKATRPPHYDEWMCIHRYEGSWVDPNAPYYGGLQMDLASSARTAGSCSQRKGTADNWSPLEQMWVAERAHASGRGLLPVAEHAPDIAISSDAAALAADDLDEPAAVALAVELEEQHALPLAEQ